jgi:hypothetical protein
MHVRAGIGTKRLQPPGCTLDTVTEQRTACALVAREQTSKQTKNPRNKQTNPRNGRLSGTGGTAHFSPFKLLQTNRRAARHHAERTLPCMRFY